MANRYWVGGTGNWSDNTNHWSATDGGAAGASLPTSADNVFFTAASNATAYTVTMDAVGSCNDMTWALPGAGVPTFAGSKALNLSGSLTAITGMVWSATSQLGFVATATGKTITTNGVSFNGSWVFNGSGGGWTLADALTLVAACTITVSAGTLNTNAQTVTTGFFVSISGTRTLTLDGSTINITGTSGTSWNIATTGALTFSATGSTVNLNGGAAGGSLLAICGGTSVTYGTFSITGAGIWTVQGATFAAFSYTSTTNKTDSISLSSNVTIAAAGTLTLAGNSVVNRAFVKSSVLGTQRTISVPSGATVTLTNVDFQDFASAGTFGTWTGTSLGDALGNSGITFDASTTQTPVATGVPINWADAANWTSRVPLPQDDVVLPALGSATTLQVNMPRMGRNIDATNFNKTLSYINDAKTIFGNITLGAGGTYSGTQALTLAGRGSHTITSNGKTFPQQINLYAFGGTYTQQDAFATTLGFLHANGTWDGATFDFSALNVSSISGLTRELRGSGFWSVTIATSTPWQVTPTGMTLSSFTATIKYTGNNTTTQAFAGGGFTYGNFWWFSTTATGTLTITGANTFADFKIDGTTARTVTFPSGVTTTLGSFTRSNQGTAILTVNSSIPGTVHTLSKASGIVSLDYLNISDSVATGGAKWFAGRNSVNTTPLTNVGWLFRTMVGFLLPRFGRILPL